MCGVTKPDKIRNERMRGTTKVGEITKRIQERRLKSYGHVMTSSDQISSLVIFYERGKGSDVTNEEGKGNGNG